MKLKRHSKTVKVAAIIGALGAVEVNFHLLQDLLGKYYGLSFTAFAVLMYYLRTITSEPVE